LVIGATYGHGYGWVVVFEAREVVSPNLTCAEMAIIYLAGEVEVDFLYVSR
jgi:hypothetical protein